MLKKIRTKVRDHFTTNFRSKKLTMCKNCQAFYYKKVWHFEAPSYIKNSTKQEIPLELTECSACIDQEVAFEERDFDLISQGMFN